MPVKGGSGEVRYDNIVYSAEPGYRPLFLDLRVPQSSSEDFPCPLIIWVHGGGWLHGSRRRQAPNIHRNRVIESILEGGFAVALVDYRLVEEEGFPAQALDLKAAIRWLRGNAGEYGLDTARFALWGESAGAHIAAMAALCDQFGDERTGEFLAESEDVQALVSWYGPADIEALLASDLPIKHSEESGVCSVNPVQALVDSTAWTAAELSPVRYVRTGVPPIFIAHGADDQQVSVEQSRKLHQALVKAGANSEYLETSGGHVFVGATVIPEVTDRSLDFLRKHLGPGVSAGLDPDIAQMEQLMSASGEFPIFPPAGQPLDPIVTRIRGVKLRDAFYPRQFFEVESVTDAAIPGPAGDIGLRIQKPLGGSDATVVYFHGGGWIIGDLDSHQGNASRIAAHAMANVVQVDYRLAPENPYPAGVEDAIAAFEWVIEHIDQFGGNLNKVVVAGDSAGGNLAAIVAQHCRAIGIRLAAQFLIYPATDLTAAADSAMLEYLGPGASSLAREPRASPALAERLDGLAPAIIGVGAHDFLYQDNVRYARALTDAGVTVIFRQYPTLNHGFFSYGSVSAASDQAAEQLCQDLHKVLHN
ncbi:alpha/beta hydrolase fold domain-containing protein [Arthrobacter sulfonylureivorans]|uniref:alpha/beta hydrolase fold domain-containing protein n=1 Tax=Arthrobacter sulfonylureivorans TaxID=2486855 RepID=UPI0039E3E17D